jgi:hypothetical protein
VISCAREAINYLAFYKIKVLTSTHEEVIRIEQFEAEKSEDALDAE